ncbi:YqiJ family protein [Phenylobacterium sp.]|jgi:hypothetical protein|uniref:YqiJ family protein n=1 Tax=Phenylobacterium sp. TaxID=1871053 RepID=UPI002E3677CD|nr:YqiJ family protein [Phenylobacterium sp.]HEX2560372.1 YqiJ family protein [Phenylobacterium sp.]
MIAFLLAPQNVPFVAALVLMLLIGLVELSGFGGAADFDIDPDTPSLLAWLNLGRLPMLMLLVVFLFAFGTVGLIAQRIVAALFGGPAPALLAVPAAVAAAFPLTRIFSRLFARFVPTDETTAVSRDSLIGRVAVIVTGEAKPGSAAQARARDAHGQPHYVMVEPDEPEEILAEGETVIIVRRAGAKFFAVRDAALGQGNV